MTEVAAASDRALQELHELLPGPLLRACRETRHPRGATLFRVGTKPRSMFYVADGEVVLERPGVQGASLILQRTRRGFVSEASLKSPRYHCDGVVVADSRIVQVPVAGILDALATDPAFSNRWVSMLSREVQRLRLKCERLSMPRIRDRLLHMLQTEGTDGAWRAESGVKSLAAELGVTHEALYRCIYALERQGVIERGPASLCLRVPPAG